MVFPNAATGEAVEKAREDTTGTLQTQRALLNILEDFDSEKTRLEDSQRALVNILDDFNSEKFRMEASQRALLNILDDFDVESAKVKNANELLTSEISERKRAEEGIRVLNENLERRSAELEATNKELEAFTYSVSHDLRSPLRHIDGFSKLLLEEDNAGLSEESRRFLSRIREGTQRMGQLVDDLLNLGRVGRSALSLQVTGLRSLADEALRELKGETAGREIEWKLQPLPFVECDPALMKQVFVNLLSNAAKYTRPRERAVIEVGARQENGAPVIFVRDNGVGFSMKYADKLFGVFQRLHRPEDFEGTGVGLATVQRIVRKHGGRIWAEAELDRGATFYFTLGNAEKQPVIRSTGVSLPQARDQDGCATPRAA